MLCMTIALAELEHALLYWREIENISSNFFLSSLSRQNESYATL